MPISDAGMGTLNALLSEPMSVSVRVMTDVNGKNLLDIKAYAVGIKLAVFVVNLDRSPSLLVRQEDILFEDTRHGRGSLIDAAPGLYMAGLRLSFTSHKCNGPFTDYEHLLILHFIVFIDSMQDCFDIILYLCFRLPNRVMFFETDGGWDVCWQVGLELDGVDAWLEHSVNNLEDWAFKFKELL